MIMFISDTEGWSSSLIEAIVPDPKPSFTRVQAAAQIARYNLKWSSDADGSTHVSYAFRSSSAINLPDYAAYAYLAPSFSRFDEDQMKLATAAFQAWSDVANILFERVGTGTSGDAAYSDNATILMGNYIANDGMYANGSYPGSRDARAIAGDLWINNPKSFGNLSFGGYTFIHEIGHTIGLAHPGEYNAGLNVNNNYINNAVYLEDTNQYTVMSYFNSSNTGGTSSLLSSSPLMDDIGAIQLLYGANMKTRTGDTVYGFNSTADRDWFSASQGGAARPVIFCVWDAGGKDTFDFSGYSDNQLIDLNAEHFSNVGGWIGNVSIASNVIIENAIGGSGNDTLVGNVSDNILNGGAGNDTLMGGAGNDTLIGGAGNDRLDGGAGLDVASYADLTTPLYVDFTQFSGTLTTALGTDTLISIEGIIGGSGDDVLKGDAGANYFESGAGQDFLDGRGGDDTLIAGAGNDGLTGGDGNDTLDGGEGDDAVLGDAGDDLLYGGAGRDYVVGGDGADRIYGGDGNDVIGGWIGNDVIYGDLGADWIYGDAGDDAIDGGDGGDGIFGGEGNDTLLGGLGDDQIIGGSGNDTMQGQDGNDILSGNEGDDNLTGAAGNDSLYGDTGNDTIDGGEGNDTLIGGYGTDSLYGGAGNDYMTGGEDNDILQGQAGDDGILGDGGNDTIDGGDGNDTLLGGDGNDTITGGLGADYFEGGTGNDSLNGGEGNDVLVGGAGQDTLTGGAGADGFFFTALTDSTSAAPDKITDFSWADGDYINLSQIDANSALAGDQAFSFVNSFTKQAGQATLTYDAASNTSTFSADVDGDGIADFVLQVTGQQDTSHGWVL